ncbi:hypothetical protein MRY87_07940 [bacterium]|nr:hypothetical protein [bacterium]
MGELLQAAPIRGKGRAVCLLRDEQYGGALFQPDTSSLETLREVLSEKNTLHEVSFPHLSGRNFSEVEEAFFEYLEQQRIRQATFVTTGSLSMLLWKVAIREQKRIRNALVIGGETRPLHSSWEQVSSWLERKLPLGLPFRVQEGNFHALPFLQRFRFPVFLFTEEHASLRLKQEAEVLARELPISWCVPSDSQDLSQIYRQLQEVPAKCPQKNR